MKPRQKEKKFHVIRLLITLLISAAILGLGYILISSLQYWIPSYKNKMTYMGEENVQMQPLYWNREEEITIYPWGLYKNDAVTSLTEDDKMFLSEIHISGLLNQAAAEYESEQKELLEKVKEEEKQLSEMEQKSVDMRLLLQGLREFTDMKELMPTIVNKLIRRIEVHNPEKKHARKSVKVDIYFTAVGLVSLPDEQEIREMMEQIHSTSQLPKQLTA